MTPELPRERARRLIAAVARRHNLSPRDIYAPGRFRHLVAARREAMRIVAAEYPSWTVCQLARLFCRHHTTVLESLGRTAKSRAAVNSRVRR